MKAEFPLLSQGKSRATQRGPRIPRAIHSLFAGAERKVARGAGLSIVLNTSSFCRKEKQCALYLEQAGHGEDTAGRLDCWEQRAYRSHEDEGGTAGKQ